MDSLKALKKTIGMVLIRVIPILIPCLSHLQVISGFGHVDFAGKLGPELLQEAPAS